MAVPVAAKAARHITRTLIAEGADRPATAQPLDVSFARKRALQRLVRNGVVRETEPGRYWLDGAAYDAWRAARLNRVLWMLMVVGVMLVVGIVLGMVRK
jgi:hypothetical protein